MRLGTAYRIRDTRADTCNSATLKPTYACRRPSPAAGKGSAEGSPLPDSPSFQRSERTLCLLVESRVLTAVMALAELPALWSPRGTGARRCSVRRHQQDHDRRDSDQGDERQCDCGRCTKTCSHAWSNGKQAIGVGAATSHARRRRSRIGEREARTTAGRAPRLIQRLTPDRARSSQRGGLRRRTRHSLRRRMPGAPYW